MWHDLQDDVGTVENLLDAARRYARGDELMEYLRFLGRFRGYAPFNAALLRTQDPDVTLVATSRQWRARFRRVVRPGARPLVILVPGGPVAFVYDIRDTDGPPVPAEVLAPFETLGRLPPGVMETAVEAAARKRIYVVRSEFSHWQAGAAERVGHDDTPPGLPRYVVRLNGRLTDEEGFATFAHELAHIFSGHLGKTAGDSWPDRSDIDPRLAEIEAEAAAFVVCARVGVRPASEKYLARHVAENGEIPPESVVTVVRTSGSILGLWQGGAKTESRRARSRRLAQEVEPALFDLVD